MSTKNDFAHASMSQVVGAPRTQRDRKPSGIPCVNEATEGQDLKDGNDKALKYRSQVCSLNRDTGIGSQERSLNGR